MSTTQKQTELRAPCATDGSNVFRLISQCPPLDANSMYCNLLQCTHFANTSISAIQNNELVGFISGYILPEQPNTLFIWQVAVGEQARGQGLAGRMLQNIIERPHCNNVKFIETTITESNKASWALFESLAKKLNTEITKSSMFDRDKHFSGKHNTEFLARIGPFK